MPAPIFSEKSACSKTEYPGVAKFGIALEWGSRGLEFESRHSDQKTIESFNFRWSFSFFSAPPRHILTDILFTILKFLLICY